MKAFSLLSVLLMTVVLSGCHCCGCTERYADVIDDVSDCNVCFDDCYCEQLDLTRLCMNRHCPRCGR